ncbi:MAG TPA: hypothetical protein VK539_05615 [Myxococcaceae bacterium]|nr:hypothetical protein [Myxococcaceae bacterium]
MRDKPLKYNHQFDLDGALRTIESVSQGFQEGSPEEEALRAAATALAYVREIGKLGDYREFFRQITTPAIESIKAAYSFSTRQEAEEWLKGAKVPDGELVSIADKGYQVVNLPQGARFLRNPLPHELESK